VVAEVDRGVFILLLLVDLEVVAATEQVLPAQWDKDLVAAQVAAIVQTVIPQAAVVELVVLVKIGKPQQHIIRAVDQVLEALDYFIIFPDKNEPMVVEAVVDSTAAAMTATGE
jgi:hypothetical protein